MFIDSSITRIRAYRAAMTWSVLRLATEAGLNESTIRRIDDPTWSPTADTLRKLEAIIPADFDPENVAEPGAERHANPEREVA